MKKISTIFSIILFIVAMKICFSAYNDDSLVIYVKLFEFLIVFSAVFALSGQIFRALNFASFFIISIYYIGKIYWHFYKKYIFFPDLIVAANPANWSVVWQYKELIVIFALFILLTIMLFFAHKNSYKFAAKFRIASLAICAVLSFGLYKFATNESIVSRWLATFPNPRDTNTNLIISFFSSSSFGIKSPNFADTYALFQEKMANVKPYKTSDMKPNLILWLEESTFDTHLYQWGRDQPLSMFSNVPNLKFSGINRVHTFGGGTMKSEFELFTGMSATNFGIQESLVFSHIAEIVKFPLPKLLKESGYKTIIINPLNTNFYDGKKAYKAFGFEEFYHPSDFGFSKCPTDPNYKIGRDCWSIPSRVLGSYVEKIIEKYPNEPLFIYVITMNEHGGYNRAKEVKFGLEKMYEKDKALAISDYYSRVIELSKAVEEMDLYLQNSKRPYIFAYFGDHHGNLSQKNSEVKLDYKNPLFITQTFVRGSKEIEPIENNYLNLGELSLNSSVLLELMQIKPNELFSAVYAMRKLCGKVDDCEDENLSKSFKSYIFDYLKNIDTNASKG